MQFCLTPEARRHFGLPRNPFVDDSALADRVGASAFRRPPGRCLN